MKRPFKDKRVLGPFVEQSNNYQFSDCKVTVTGTPLIYSTGEYKEFEYHDGKVGEIEIFNFNAELCGCSLNIGDFHIGDESDSFKRYVYHIKHDNVSVGNSWIIEDEEGLFLSHLIVDDEYRGLSVSDLFFDIFIKYAEVAKIDNISGSIAGGLRTKKFFEKMGVPSEDIEMVDKGKEEKSAKFNTTLDKVKL